MIINIFYDDVSFRIRSGNKIRKLVQKIALKEGKFPGSINIILTSDNSLLGINKEFLKHNYFTDVICFGYNENKTINGEVYISIETIRKNSINYKVSLNNELVRVIIHGILHLCGYEDNSAKRKKGMVELEDYWLEVYKNL